MSSPMRAQMELEEFSWWVETQQVIPTRAITVHISILCEGRFLFLSSRPSTFLFVDSISNSSKATAAELFVYLQQMGLVSASQIAF